MELFITQRDKESSLYTRLQRSSIDRLERLTGKIWTDYNAHDPGVTILDVLNYALTELEFKLGFPLEDYLAGEKNGFFPENLGFFLPWQVFPVSPVTVEDYRELLLMNIPELENVWVKADKDSGRYDISPEVFSFMSGVVREDIEKKVKKLFQANRNLCEYLGKIDFVAPEKIHLVADIRIQPGRNATDVLVDLFYAAYTYVARSVEFRMPDERRAAQIPPDEWLDGPNDTNVQISVIPDQVVRTETELYHLLCHVEGVQAVYSCYMKGSQDEIINSFDKHYQLLVPENSRELEMNLTVETGETPAVIKMDRFVSDFQAKCLSAGKFLKSERGKKFTVAYPAGENHSLYHDTILNDFPDCYGVNEKGLSAYVSVERKAQRKQLMAYLELFDFTLIRGITELNKLLEWMGVLYKEQIQILSGQMSDPDFFIHTEEEVLLQCCNREMLEEKKWQLDMLDAIYGEDSDPNWLNEYNYYEDTVQVRIKQRNAFLQQVPLWGKKRFAACDWSGEQDEKNISGVKAYVSALLSWERDEGKAVGNIFPSYNLNFITDEEYESELKRMLKSDLIPERMLSQYNIEPVETLDEEYGEKDYEEMRFTLSYFNNNLIHESLFQEGINIENFKLISLGKMEYLLAFRSPKRNVCMSLGRLTHRNRLNRMANILRQFLLKLNRESEVMYVVEHQYFNKPGSFELTVVLAGWSARMATARFREICENFILSRLPVHVRVDFCWMDTDHLQQFEVAWRKWRQNKKSGDQPGAAVAMGRIEEILMEMKK